MAELKPDQVDTFLSASRLPQQHFFLFYGSDKALSIDRLGTLRSRLVKQCPRPTEVLKLGDEDYSQFPDKLFVELETGSMFGDIKILQTPLHRKLDQKRLTALIETPIDDYLLILAPNLKKTQALYKKFKASQNCLLVPSYPFSTAELGTYLRAQMEEKQLAAPPEVFAIMQNMLATDRSLIRSELEKLSLYLGERREVTEPDLFAIWNNSFEPALDDIVHAVGLKQMPKALTFLDQALTAGNQPGTIGIVLTHHFLRLLKLVSQLAGPSGKQSMGQIRSLIQQQRPPIHFSRRDDFIRQCELYSSAEIMEILTRLQQLTIRFRTDNILHKEALENFILKHCQP